MAIRKAVWGGLATVGGIVVTGALLAAVGDDLGQGLHSVSGATWDNVAGHLANASGKGDPGVISSMTYYIGSAFVTLSDWSASIFTSIFNGVSDLLNSASSVPADDKSHVQVEDFKSFFGGEVSIPNPNPVSTTILTPGANSVVVNAPDRIAAVSDGITGVIGKAWENASNSATGTYIGEHNGQALLAAGTTIVGAHLIGNMADRVDDKGLKDGLNPLHREAGRA